MHQAMAAGHLPSSLVPSSLSAHGGYSPGQLGAGNRSPVSSPTPQPPSLTNPAHMGYVGGLTPGNNSHNTSGTNFFIFYIPYNYGMYLLRFHVPDFI